MSHWNSYESPQKTLFKDASISQVLDLCDVTESKFALLKTKSEGLLPFGHDSSLVAQAGNGRRRGIKFFCLVFLLERQPLTGVSEDRYGKSGFVIQGVPE